MNFNFHVYHYGEDNGEAIKGIEKLLLNFQLQLTAIQNNQQTMANSIAELTAKVDELQTTLDTEQEQIKTSIDELKQANADLQAMITDGGTPEERQALADKLDTIITDLKGTIPDE